MDMGEERGEAREGGYFGKKAKHKKGRRLGGNGIWARILLFFARTHFLGMQRAMQRLKKTQGQQKAQFG